MLVQDENGEDGGGGDGEDVDHGEYVEQKTLYLDEDR